MVCLVSWLVLVGASKSRDLTHIGGNDIAYIAGFDTTDIHW
jgi:hypothetical protein